MGAFGALGVSAACMPSCSLFIVLRARKASWSCTYRAPASWCCRSVDCGASAPSRVADVFECDGARGFFGRKKEDDALRRRARRRLYQPAAAKGVCRTRKALEFQLH
ncbi:hypothetical protein MTO96_008524 [Rhipicephalus appendiculatus]